MRYYAETTISQYLRKLCATVCGNVVALQRKILLACVGNWNQIYESLSSGHIFNLMEFFLFGLRKLAQVCFIDFPTKMIFHKHFVRDIFKFRSCWDFQEVCSCLLHISQFRTVQYGLRINNWTVGGQKHATAQQYWRPGRVCVGGEIWSARQNRVEQKCEWRISYLQIMWSWSKCKVIQHILLPKS